MLSGLANWLGRTPRERALGTVALAAWTLVLVWFGRDDPWPLLALTGGWVLAVAGVQKLYPADGSTGPRWSGFLLVGGLSLCAAAGVIGGGNGFGFILAVFLVLMVAKRRAAPARSA